MRILNAILIVAIACHACGCSRSDLQKEVDKARAETEAARADAAAAKAELAEIRAASPEAATEPSQPQPKTEPAVNPTASSVKKGGLGAGGQPAGIQADRESASDAAKAWAKRMLVVTNPRDNMIKRSGKLKESGVSDAIKAWKEALQEKSGDSVDATNFLLFFVVFDPVFEDHVFQPEHSDKYVQRIKSLPADAMTVWQELVNQVAENQIEKNNAIIQIDRLFRVAEFNRAEFDILKARARALPADSIKTLAETAGRETKREQAFSNLLTQDWLYRRDGSFNQDIFREALGYVPVQQKEAKQ